MGTSLPGSRVIVVIRLHRNVHRFGLCASPNCMRRHACTLACSLVSARLLVNVHVHLQLCQMVSEILPLCTCDSVTSPANQWQHAQYCVYLCSSSWQCATLQTPRLPLLTMPQDNCEIQHYSMSVATSHVMAQPFYSGCNPHICT